MSENENLAERVGTEVLDFEDRRRIACSEMFLTAERSGGGVYPNDFGMVVLRSVVGEDEIVKMGDRIVAVLIKTGARPV